MAKYQLKLHRDLCQGQFVCTAADGKHFERDDDNKANLIGGSVEGDLQTVDVEESDFEKAKIAADGCAFDAIELIDKETEEVIAPK